MYIYGIPVHKVYHPIEKKQWLFFNSFSPKIPAFEIWKLHSMPIVLSYENQLIVQP